MASTLGLPHHNHFAHHVRTKGWGIEPGLKFVTHDDEKMHFFEPRRSFRSSRDAPAGTHRFPFLDNGIGRSTPHLSRSSSFRERPSGPSSSVTRNIEIKLLDHPHRQPRGSSAPRFSSSKSNLENNDVDLHQWPRPLHITTTTSFNRPSFSSSTLPKSSTSLGRPLPMPLAETDLLKSLPQPEVAPPGILKASNGNIKRGPKTMKKVAFLENVEGTPVRGVH